MSRGGAPIAREPAPGRLLRLAYADAAPLAAGAWRLTIGFGTAAPARAPIRPPPPDTLRFRPLDGPDHARLRAVRTGWIEPGRVLVADLDLAGSSTAAGTYLLRIDCPDVVDPEAAAARFEAPETLPAEPRADTAVDYLTKDGAGFRHLMTSTIGRHMPRWTDSSEADIGTTIVESLAYAADFLSYHQDAVATEAYLDTARQRRSLRRHLRLLGYRPSEGCAPRVLLHLVAMPGTGFAVPAGTAYTAAPDLPTIVAADDGALRHLLADGRPVYTQIADATLHPEMNRLELATPGGLRAGGTHVPMLTRAPGEILKHASGQLFAVTGTTGGTAAVLHPFRVRAVSLRGAPGPGDAALAVFETDPADAMPCDVDAGAVVIGNLVPAEFGRVVRDEVLPMPSRGRPYRPRLAERGVVPVVPVEPLASAAALLAPRPEDAVAAITLREVPLPETGLDAAGCARRWQPATDLLACSAFARRFVVETDEAGATSLRFGDGVFGRRPPAEARLVAEYRVGALPGASVGADQLDTLIAPSNALFENLQGRLLRVSNPLPSRGLHDPEPERRAIVRGKADFRIVRTCATLADYAAAAEEVHGVAEAVASVRRTGSVAVIVVRLRAAATLFVAEPLLDAVREAIRGRMLPGLRLAVLGPRFARLTIGLAIRPEGSAEAGRVGRAVEAALSADRDGLFAPARLAFGRPVFASRIQQAVARVPGVAEARVTRLTRAGAPDAASCGTLMPAADEIPVVGELGIALEAAT